MKKSFRMVQKRRRYYCNYKNCQSLLDEGVKIGLCEKHVGKDQVFANGQFANVKIENEQIIETAKKSGFLEKLIGFFFN